MIDKAFIEHRSATDPKHSFHLHIFCVILSIFIVFADIAIPLGAAMPVLYILIIWISFLSHKPFFTVSMTVWCSILTVIVVFFQPSVSEMWKVFFNRSIALLAIWMTSYLGLQWKKSERKIEKAIHDREKAVSETRILRGMIPICSSCKKIRENKDDWTQLEVYIRDHSEAEFSHGLCPECIKQLYPELQK